MKKTPHPGSVARSFRTAFAVILGTNEIASAVAVYMHRSGWCTVLSHDGAPPVIRRRMAYHDALFGESVDVDGLPGLYAETAVGVANLLGGGDCVVVTRLGLLDLIPLSPIHVLVDARMHKHEAVADLRHLASLTVGVGPGFAVARNCDVAIETLPSKNGTILYTGRTEAADGKPRLIGGIGGERFAYAQTKGCWRSAVDIGTRVSREFPMGFLNGAAVPAPLDGLVRGIVRDNSDVAAGVKLLEIDPRKHPCWTGIDERGRAIARAAMNAIAFEHARRNKQGASMSIV
jgi:xanthine dehydrogenase accessory factor